MTAPGSDRDDRDDRDQHARRATSFDDTAAAYEFGRPGYPPAALAWWAQRGGLSGRVLDLGAGTGKLTRQLAGVARSVIAVEPLQGMREQFRLAVPGVEVLDGTAESIPVPDRSVDAVYVAQAFHWFDHQVALREIARVLRPGGGLGLIWNRDDTSVDWVQRYAADKHRGRQVSGAVAADDPPSLDEITRFGWTGESTEIRWAAPTSKAQLVANALSRSYISVLPAEQRPEALRGIREIVGALSEPIELPMIAWVSWCMPPT